MRAPAYLEVGVLTLYATLLALMILSVTGCGIGREPPTAPDSPTIPEIPTTPEPPTRIQKLHLAILMQPGSLVESGAVISPAIRVAIQDTSGETVTSAVPGVSVALSGGEAVLGGTRFRIPVNGIATFGDLTVDKVGQYSLTVSALLLESVTSEPFVVSPGPPGSLHFAVQPPTAVVAGRTIAPDVVVTVLDRNSNVASNDSSAINLQLVDARGAPVAFRGTQTRRALDGVATFDDLTVDADGVNYTLRATSPSLSHGTSSNHFRIVRFPPDFALATITVGLDQTCGLSQTGTAYCWGDNGFGQLGDGSFVDSPIPVPVAGGLTFTTLSAGGGGYDEDVSFACGVTTAGDGYCWGGSHRGALGEGSRVAAYGTPVPVAGGLKFQTISAGGAHACGLTTAGVAYCWGSNEFGELGVGDRILRSTPTPVVGDLRFATITSGDFHTCAANTEATYCWGGGIVGHTLAPVEVNTNLHFRSISAATAHTCGITLSPSAFCWGDNSAGQLGDGSGVSSAIPVAVGGGDGFDVISTKGYTTCGIREGRGYCWGWNDLGQLGIGFVTGRGGNWTPLPVKGSLVFTSVSVGVWHVCALSVGGAAYCWGFNSDGQLGNLTEVDSAEPVRVGP